MPANLVVKSSTIPVGTNAVIGPRTYSSADLEWGRNRWQTRATTDMERAEVTVRSIMQGLKDSVGVPSDVMGEVAPRGQYERASAGVDKVWCSQIAQILHFALTSIGVHARVVRTAPPCQYVGENQVIQALDTPLESELRFKRFDPARGKASSVTTADLRRSAV